MLSAVSETDGDGGTSAPRVVVAIFVSFVALWAMTNEMRVAQTTLAVTGPSTVKPVCASRLPSCLSGRPAGVYSRSQLSGAGRRRRVTERDKVRLARRAWWQLFTRSCRPTRSQTRSVYSDTPGRPSTTLNCTSLAETPPAAAAVSLCDAGVTQ